MNAVSSQKFVAERDYADPQGIADVADRVFTDQGAVPGVAQSDIDLARYTSGEKAAVPGNSSPFQAMHVEARDGGEAFLTWLGDSKTQTWLTDLVGGAPLVFSTALRKLGSGIPGSTIPFVGTSSDADSIYSVCLRLDSGEQGVQFELYANDEGALAREPSSLKALGSNEAIAIRHDTIRCSADSVADGLVLEFTVTQDPRADKPLPHGWNEKNLAARRRTMGIARMLAQPDDAGAISEQFQPPLRSAAEELPLTRILAAPASATRLIVPSE